MLNIFMTGFYFITAPLSGQGTPINLIIGYNSSGSYQKGVVSISDTFKSSPTVLQTSDVEYFI